jgi:anti-sigma factor RsiW
LESLRLSPEDRENLVAYLDGELSEAASRSLATKLTSSAAARRDVETLMATWEALDLLERPTAPEDFASRTLTGIAHEGGAFDRSVLAASSWGRVALRVAAGVVAVALAGVVGFVATRHVWPDPTARLARQLSLAEHLDEYRAVGGDFDFLRQLDESPEFNASRE